MPTKRKQFSAEEIDMLQRHIEHSEPTVHELSAIMGKTYHSVSSKIWKMKKPIFQKNNGLKNENELKRLYDYFITGCKQYEGM